MRHKVLLFTSLILFGSALAQRISTGVTLGTPALHRTTLPDNYLFPSNSYFIYFTANEDKDNKPIYDQIMNGITGGFNINVDYKRYMFTTEILGSQTTVKIPVLYQSYLGSLLEDSWSTMTVQNNNVQLNLLLNVRLNTRANGPFAQAGLQWASNSYLEKNRDLDADISSALSLWMSDYEMYKILYSSDLKKYNALLGIGYKLNDNYYSIRYTQNIGSQTNLPLAQYFRLDGVYSRVLNFQKLRKGHKIYVE